MSSLSTNIIFKEKLNQRIKIAIDHVHLYVKDTNHWKKWFIDVMGFYSIAGGKGDCTHTEIVKTGSKENSIIFVISSPLSSQSPVAKYLEIHPPGVADVAFSVNDLQTILGKIDGFYNGIKESIKERAYPRGYLKWSKIFNQNGLTHSVFERRGNTPVLPKDWLQERAVNVNKKNYFLELDHLVLNVAKGQMKSTMKWYEQVLEFQKKQFFKIETPRSGLYSQVLFHPVGNIQLPINEPISRSSQIQEFLDINNGSGIQHIALRTNKIAEVTQQLRKKGVAFLKVPSAYYENLAKVNLNLKFHPEEWQTIVKENILLDQEGNKEKESRNKNYPLLLQIFTQPIFEQPTFFFEIIERRKDATGFGEGNFQALFEAVEREQRKRGTLIN
ncbi:4-hydroxyphenylpyruvate dioxygenase [Crocosphaera sp. Alani8]|uniref:4-hydroxyphenylpyruvate dioxygenase n=1 Tax=Crocosphaera sp. Alani8 TaxID=3038952 RepID=UPI00313C39C8